jgi:hypothetical protein
MRRADSTSTSSESEAEEGLSPSSEPLWKRMLTIRRDVTTEFDATIWLGDLNYRIDGTREAVEAAVKAGNLHVRSPPSCQIVTFFFVYTPGMHMSMV